MTGKELIGLNSRLEHVIVNKVNHVKIGLWLRDLRLVKRVSLRRAALGLKLSAPFLSDLELGKRNWDEEKIDKYLKYLGWHK